MSQSIHIALADHADPEINGQSWVIGAFSSDALAEKACAEYSAENNGLAAEAARLEFKDAEATGPDGIKYAIILVDLDIPV